MSLHLEVWLEDCTLGPAIKIGELDCDRGRGSEVIRFSYSPAWLATARAIAIDPELPLVQGPQYPGGRRALHGIFRDTAPDRWGRVLMERREAIEAQRENRRARRLRDWDFLTGVNDQTRMGALRLWDPEVKSYVDVRELGAPPATRLRELEAIVELLEAEGSEDRPEYVQWLRQLIAPGTSLGGSRPKASFTAEDGTLWLAKFPASDDRRDVGAWEFLAYQLALRAGVVMPEAKLLRFARRHRTFVVKRFDRVHDSRRLYASAMTLLQRNDGDEGSYVDIAEAIQNVGAPVTIAADLTQLYRRIVFSIFIGNRDDHLRNHGFLWGGDGWSLSPAFDINPNPDKGEHALAIDDVDSSPSIDHLRVTADYYRLSRADADAIENEVRAAVDGWRQVAASLDLPAREIKQLEAVLESSR